MPQGGQMPGGAGGGMENTGELISISGGTLTVNAGGDGIDSNGSVEITGGDTTVWGPTNAGNGSLDANGEITISGGMLLAVGSSGMAESPTTDSEQGWLSGTATGDEGAEVTVSDADGAALASFTATKQFGSVVFSSADVESGATYTITVDGTETSVTAGEAAADGMGGQPGGAPDEQN